MRSFVASLVVLAGVLALGAPARGAPVSPFREVAVGKGIQVVQSDGVRFAWAFKYASSAVRVFDTLRGRSFRLAAPAPGCEFASIGGGYALWTCDEPRPVLLQNLSTGRVRQPAGVEQLLQMPSYLKPCLPVSQWQGQSVGRYWLAFACGYFPGGYVEPTYLNHRTGRLRDSIDPYAPGAPSADLDSPRVFSPYCAPLDGLSGRQPSFEYKRPFALAVTVGMDPKRPSIVLRRCGTRRAEVLSRCPQTDCRDPQLGSDYVTWGEFKRVYAYLPRIRQRVLVGRAPADFVHGRQLSVAHTCNRIFARWGNTIYAARFEPARGAPPCQSALG